MRENAFNQEPLPDDAISSFFKTGEFGNLSEENKKIVLDKLPDKKNGDGGLLGKFFGNKKENSSMHIAFTICCILLLFCCVDIIHALWIGKSAYTELVKNIIPVVTLALGYIFGKGEK